MSTSQRSFESIESDLEAAGGLMAVHMQVLRDAHGVERLGKHVRRNIHNKLLRMGIGYFPRPLPEHQEGQVRLYKLGSLIDQSIGDLFDFSEEADERLRAIFTGDSEAIIQRIRELVLE